MYITSLHPCKHKKNIFVQKNLKKNYSSLVVFQDVCIKFNPAVTQILLCPLYIHVIWCGVDDIKYKTGVDCGSFNCLLV